MLIYKITNVKNNKVYIGQTVKSENLRWLEHLSALRSNRHFNEGLQYDFNIHGEESFKIDILEENVENLDEREIYWITHFNSITEGYNRSSGGQFGIRYFKTWVGLIDPNGNSVGPIENLAAFCRKHNLSEKFLRRIFSGERVSHKGWTVTGRVKKQGFTWPKGLSKTLEHRSKISDSVKRSWKQRKYKLGV